MILHYNKNNSYKYILNGFINVYNIEQNEIEDPLAKEIHQLINYKIINNEIKSEEINKYSNSYNKNYVTKSNLLINGIFNKMNYVNSNIIID